MSKLDAKNMFVANLELRLCGGGRETGLSVIEAELVQCCKVERGRVVSKSSFVLDDGTRPTFFVVFWHILVDQKCHSGYNVYTLTKQEQ